MRRVPPAKALVRLAAGAWLAGLAGLAIAVYGPGEAFWPVTLFLFGPRFVLALPLVLLLPAAALFDRRSLVALLAAAALGAGPLFGWNVPWPSGRAARADAPRIRIASWNLGGGGRFDDALALVGEEAPDLVVLQEAPGPVEAPPGWHLSGERGNVLLSRYPVRATAERDPRDVWAMNGSGAIVRYTVETPLGRLDLTNLHLETPRDGIEAVLGAKGRGVPVLEAKNAQRGIEHRMARLWVDASPSALRVVAGDFNTPVESRFFRDHWNGFADCHSAAGWGFGFTKRTRKIGVRIDHVLAGPGLACVAARTGRGGAGDHAPVITELTLAR